MWNYLPHSKIFFITRAINNLIKLNALVIFFGLLTFIPYYYYQKNFLKGRIITLNLVLIILFYCLILSAIFNLPKTFYDADYFYILMIVILIFFIGENSLFDLKSNFFKKVLIYSIFLSTLSQLTFVVYNLRPFIKGAVSLGIPIGKYEKQRIHNSINDASKACSIDPVESQYVVTDDLTYGFFRRSHGPVSFTYLFVDSQKNPLKILFNTVDSSGMVLDCDVMPENLRKESIKVNNICCLSQKKIKDLYVYNN
jgi:hypothetical protein